MFQAWLTIQDTKTSNSVLVLVRRDLSVPGAYDYPLVCQTWREQVLFDHSIGWEGEGNWVLSIESEGVRFWEGGHTLPSFILYGGNLTSYVGLPFRKGQSGTGFHNAYGAKIGPNDITWSCSASTGAEEQN